ncbi:uncharacterized protein EV154DRAFT_423831 [Mucor mucedo]|uniref:uncharacterized protein n=1 Tax=Mucor mucedo TaxID=29922 RepID=UPI002220A5F8|nr:uncharacterized protein EV154DRAFT_423831 [Mucor mucedo]KAI7889412.1 hypothetical protein EV154DRAFT_423831 [Mucor mucedo]
MRPFIHKKINEEESNTLVEDVEQRGQLIQNLNSSITGYSTHIKEFIHNSPYYNEHEYKTKVDTCKALVAQQQSLLDKLQTTITTTIQPPSSTLPSQPFLPPALAPSPAPADEPTPVTTTTNISPIKSLYTEIYKGLKSSTTGFTIKQKKDKNDADTIIAVKGVCTTVEASLIPDRDDITTFHQSSVYQHQYSLEITQHDRLTKYILMHPDQWQKDEKVNTCSFKNCPHTFNWFQRKHHCRGCGQIYCNTHSGNRLPLFDKEAKPVFSRVCDNCFYHLAAHSLS